jgi:hypothetical protein
VLRQAHEALATLTLRRLRAGLLEVGQGAGLVSSGHLWPLADIPEISGAFVPGSPIEPRKAFRGVAGAQTVLNMATMET